MTYPRVMLVVLLTVLSGPVTSGQNPTPGQPVMPGQPTPPGQPVPPGAPTPGSRTPPRAGRPGEDPQKGTAVLRGRVTAADTGNPLRRAVVRASAQGSQGVATTDADGRFEIKELLAGRYTVSAQKAGYVSTSFGQRRPEQPGTMLDVLDGQHVEKIELTLPRGGVITGKVTDEFGEAVAGAQVSAMRFRFMNGARRLMPSGSGSTDDQGSFRIYGLTPGEYYVSGTLRSMASMVTTGSGSVAAAEIEGFAPTYYPGTPNAAEAQRLTVRVGLETTGINFALTPARLRRIRGRVISSSGEPVLGMVQASPADRFAGGMSAFPGFTQTRPDGTFDLTGVPEGSYIINVMPRGRIEPNVEFGQTRVTVAETDLDNVLIVTGRGATARGIIRTDDGTQLSLLPQQVSVYSRTPEPETFPTGGGEPRVNDDWTFEVPGLIDRCILMPGTGSPEWSLKAVLLNGEDVTDTPVQFTPGTTIEGFEIVLTRKRTDLSGNITDDRGPVLDATVVVFPQDRNRWTFASRFMRTARPDQQGRYQLLGLPPADYFLIALTELEAGRQQDPEFLESIRDYATRVSLEEAETEVRNLKVVKTPQ